ncbi:MAG: hypothetical protein Q9162_000633 [Coniocarpon cinnabarinum]
MVNSNRGPKGRFVNHNVHTHTENPSSPKEALQNAERPSKRRRLDDGCSKPLAKSPTPNTPNTSAPRSPARKQLNRSHRSRSCKSASDVAASDTTPAKTDEKRTLRSQDATRRRSDLLNFFADFETITFGPSRADDTVYEYTRLMITEEPPQASLIHKLDDSIPTPLSAVRHFKNSIYTGHESSTAAPSPSPMNKKTKQQAQRIFKKIRLPPKDKFRNAAPGDPLSDEIYDAAHRRGERKEKQARNWEKERALHEKSELERLLQGLKGQDWLKTMGIINASEHDTKHYITKRNIFIKRAQSMLDRYAAWNQRDRQLKLEKEQRLAEEEDESSSDDSDSRTSATISASEENERLKRVGGKRKAPDQQSMEQKKPQQQHLAEQKEFKSFFEKPHMREAAMKSHRRGRHVLAFGLPIPALPEVADFDLPQDITTHKKATFPLQESSTIDVKD